MSLCVILADAPCMCQFSYNSVSSIEPSVKTDCYEGQARSSCFHAAGPLVTDRNTVTASGPAVLLPAHQAGDGSAVIPGSQSGCMNGNAAAGEQQGEASARHASAVRICAISAIRYETYVAFWVEGAPRPQSVPVPLRMPLRDRPSQDQSSACLAHITNRAAVVQKLIILRAPCVFRAGETANASYEAFPPGQISVNDSLIQPVCSSCTELRLVLHPSRV